jgi:hypothetical protein
MLAYLETEHNWRHAYQPLDVAAEMRALAAAGASVPRTRLDELLEEYSRRWAREEFDAGRRDAGAWHRCQ